VELRTPGGSGPDVKLKANNWVKERTETPGDERPRHVYSLVYAQEGILDSVLVGDLEPADGEHVVATYFDPDLGCYSICTRDLLQE